MGNHMLNGSIQELKGIGEKTAKLFEKLHICSYTVKFLLLFWKYSDRVDSERYQSKDISYTLKFFYKRLFQPIEKLFTGKLFKR